MSRLKSLISRGFNAFNTRSPRLFSTSQSFTLWENMTHEERIGYAMCDHSPETSEIAYYKALGLLKGGNELVEHAVAALEQAINLSDGNYWVATCKLAEVYTKLGLEDQALKVYQLGVARLNEAIKSSDTAVLSGELKKQLLIDSNDEKSNPKITHSLT